MHLLSERDSDTIRLCFFSIIFYLVSASEPQPHDLSSDSRPIPGRQLSALRMHASSTPLPDYFEAFRIHIHANLRCERTDTR